MAWLTCSLLAPASHFDLASLTMSMLMTIMTTHSGRMPADCGWSPDCDPKNNVMTSDFGKCYDLTVRLGQICWPSFFFFSLRLVLDFYTPFLFIFSLDGTGCPSASSLYWPSCCLHFIHYFVDGLLFDNVCMAGWNFCKLKVAVISVLSAWYRWQRMNLIPHIMMLAWEQAGSPGELIYVSCTAYNIKIAFVTLDPRNAYMCLLLVS